MSDVEITRLQRLALAGDQVALEQLRVAWQRLDAVSVLQASEEATVGAVFWKPSSPPRDGTMIIETVIVEMAYLSDRWIKLKESRETTVKRTESVDDVFFRFEGNEGLTSMTGAQSPELLEPPSES